MMKTLACSLLLLLGCAVGQTKAVIWRAEWCMLGVKGNCLAYGPAPVLLVETPNQIPYIKATHHKFLDECGYGQVCDPITSIKIYPQDVPIFNCVNDICPDGDGSGGVHRLGDPPR
jgi:hypothetical protein